jgi:hypothetical protein
VGGNIFERGMNINMAQKIYKMRNHSVLLQRERELNIVPKKCPSDMYPELLI